MSLFKRLFRVSQAEAHAIVDKFEDPIKMTEQGIRDLKKDLQASMTSFRKCRTARWIRPMPNVWPLRP